MAFTGTDVMNSQQYLNALTELNALKTNKTLAKGRLYYIGDTKAIAVANANNEYIPLYENAIGSELAFTAATSKITYKTPFGVEKELSLADLNAATATKLKNERLIWGQKFDGSADVEGALSKATTGAFSSHVTVGGHLTVGSIDGSYVQIGALRLVYDATNNAIKLLDPNTTTPKNANFYATGSVAAFGPGTISGGGGSAVSILDKWTDYNNDTMSMYALSAGLGYDMLLRIEDLEQNSEVSYGSATSSYVPLTVGSTTRNLSISGHTHTITNVTGLQAALNLKAPLASPTFTGTPKADTAAQTVNNTQIATTAFVHTAVTNAISSVFTYKGSATVAIINAKANSSTPVGHAFRLTTAGKINNAVDADKDAAVGDMVICTQANPIQWSILQNNIDTADLESRLDTVETLLTWILPTT